MKGRYNTKQNHSSGTSFANGGWCKPLKVAPESLNSLGIGGSGGADPPVRIRLPFGKQTPHKALHQGSPRQPNGKSRTKTLIFQGQKLKQ